MSSVAGLKAALKDYESDKVKDRASGGERIRAIFGNKENVLVFQETASREGGAGWVALFQCLFQVVVMEKKAFVRNATAQAERRLTDAVSLVRWMAERTLHHLGKKPVLALVRHMTALLVHAGKVFDRTVRDYAKALRSLLSYPPHLESVPEADWKRLMSLCWAGVLGDRILSDEQWQDEGQDELDESAGEGRNGDGDMLGTPSASHGPGELNRLRGSFTQEAIELLNLIPILLSSSSAPIIPPFPTVDSAGQSSCSVGYSILLKINRFMEHHPAETSGHLSLMRSCNLVLVELELNSRQEVVQAGSKLLPKLVALWSTRNKLLREQLLIALRLLLPWMAAVENVEDTLLPSLRKLVDWIPKESASRWGIEPLDLQTLRLNALAGPRVDDSHPYNLNGIEPGFDFSHEHAYTWMILDLYAQAVLHLHRAPTSDTTARDDDAPTARATKRRRVEEPLTTLASGISGGTTNSRLLSLQILGFFMAKGNFPPANPILRAAIDSIMQQLEGEDELHQTWSFLVVATIPTFDPNTSMRIWALAMRRMTVPAVARAASFCAVQLLRTRTVPSETATKDISGLLKQIDIQGPPFPYDSVCALLATAIEIVQSDIRLYSSNLVDRATSWLEKHDLIGGVRGRTRMDPTTPRDLLQLLGGLASIPAVDRILEEWRTRIPRRFILEARSDPSNLPAASVDATIPQQTAASTPPFSSMGSEAAPSDPDPAVLLKCQRVLAWLDTQLVQDLTDWDAAKAASNAARSYERVRKSLDFIILFAGFTASAKAVGVNPADGVLSRFQDLVGIVAPELASTETPPAMQNFMWQGIVPLLPPPSPPLAPWPIFLRANAEISGIRSDRLPPSLDPDSASAETKHNFLATCWTAAGIAGPLQTFVSLSRQLTNPESVVVSSSGSYATQRVTVTEDDDFGEIRVAETEAMPLSKEAQDGQRTARSLLAILISVRLAGPLLTSPSQIVPRDIQLLNAFLSAEGIRMTQLGEFICQAVHSEQLRLSVDAIELIIDKLDQDLESYAYSRNEAQLLLVLNFLQVSAPIWLHPDVAGTETAERAINLASYIAQRAVRGQAQSWRVRLQLLVFLDDYLDYDPNFAEWSRPDLASEDNATSDPPAVINRSMVDPDIRVRIRAATSCAGLFCLPNMPSAQHQNFYLDTMEEQPRHPEHWNAFLTDILWKLNCCIISSATRSAALYHLYEVPFSTSSFNKHLQAGLEAVCSRLGLASLRDLWRDFNPVIVSSLLGGGQKPLQLAPGLCGYADQASRAKAELEVLGTRLLVDDHLGYFNLLCEVSGVPSSNEALKHFYPIIARVLARLVRTSTKSDDKRIMRELSDNLSSLPGAGKIGAGELIAQAGTNIAVECCRLAGDIFPRATFEKNLAVLGAAGMAVYDRLSALLPGAPLAAEADEPDLLSVLGLLERTCPTLNRDAVCFNVLVDTCARLDTSSLVSELERNVYVLVVNMSVFAEEIASPRILLLLLIEATSIIRYTEVASTGFAILTWGFERLATSKTVNAVAIAQVVARLGRARGHLSPGPREFFDDWVLKHAPSWQKSPTIWSVETQQAIALWPDELRQCIDSQDSLFLDISKGCDEPSPQQVMMICERLSQSLTGGDNNQNRAKFSNDLFWKLKDSFSDDSLTPEGALSFISALEAVDGQVLGPDKITFDRKGDAFLSQTAASCRNDPYTASRILIAQYLLKLATSDDRHLRSAALTMLRNLRSTMADLLERNVLPKDALIDLSLFASPIPESASRTITYRLASLSDTSLRLMVGDATAWLRAVCLRLVDVCAEHATFFRRLGPIFSHSVETCKALFPYLVQATLAQSSEPKTVKKRQTALGDLLHASLLSLDASHEVLAVVLNAMLHLRRFTPLDNPNKLSFNSWVNFDYLLLAEAAVRIGSYATALLCLEIGKADVETIKADLFNSRVQSIMMAVYSNVDDPDGFYGIKTHNVRDALRRRLDHEGQYQRAFGLHGANLEATNSSAEFASDLVASVHDLHHMGFHQAARTISEVVKKRDERFQSSEGLFFDVAWRTGDWDLPVSSTAKQTSSGAFYSALRALHRDRSEASVRTAISIGLKNEMLRLKSLGNERMLDIQRTVDDLICMREAALWTGASVQKALSEGDYASPMLARFGHAKASQRYVLAEKVYATRTSILSSAVSRENRNVLGDLGTPLSDALKALQIQSHLNFSAFARSQDSQQAAVNAITAVQHLEGACPSAAAADEYGEVLWMQKEHTLALQLVQEMTDTLRGEAQLTEHLAGRLGLLMGRLANWSYLARLMPSNEATDMFDRAYTQLSKHRAPEEELAHLSYDFAMFATEQQATMRVAPQLVALREYRSRKQADLQLLDASLGGKRESKASEKLRQERHADMKEDAKAIDQFETRIDNLVKQALKMFGYALRYSDTYNESVTKMCSLWLAYGDPKNFTDHLEMRRAEAISQGCHHSLQAIASHKFLFLGPQLAARIYRPSAPTKFNTLLNSLLLKIAREHPFHILYQIIPIAYGASQAGKGKRLSVGEVEGREPAAAELLSILNVEQVRILARTASQQMTQFADHAMAWSLTPPPSASERKQKSFNVPKTAAIANFTGNSIPVATVIPPIRHDEDYKDVPHLLRYRSQYVLLGGLHRPKKMKVLDSIGGEHQELFKGEDEIRQDAIFEQVFGVTNRLLSRDRQTKSRHLRFRTYVVIPLAQKTGILEFVAEGIGIGEWIKPAHEYYRKTIDVSSNEIRDALTALQRDHFDHPQLRPVFEEKMTRFRPVMRHFFTEKHKDPLGWFGMRLAYSRSVAVTSMVGYVLGVGDRHLSNIMIDQHNGELIHIDFGIVFEDGEKLRIPERVPFRLTNDIVDGLGITGVDGTFRRCAEQTIRVLRENKDLIMTVLEVFKHDPLYAWTGDPEKVQKAGGNLWHLGRDATVLEKADRVLGRIRQKLADDLSVEYTVNMLIQKARDPEHLAKIFVGWHAWC